MNGNENAVRRGGAGGVKDDQHTAPSHNGNESSTAVWFKLHPARWAGLAMRESDNAKLGERVRRIILALCEQKPGMDDFADDVMKSTAEAMRAASEHGQKAARARWMKDKDGCPSNARASSPAPTGYPSNAKREDSEDETRGDLSTDPKPSEPEPPRVVKPGLEIGNIGRGDTYDRIEYLRTDDELVNFTADYCGDANRTWAIFGYKAVIAKIGKEAFRSELAAFVGACDAGEDCRNRGAAFMARLKDAVEAKGERG